MWDVRSLTTTWEQLKYFLFVLRSTGNFLPPANHTRCCHFPSYAEISRIHSFIFYARFKARNSAQAFLYELKHFYKRSNFRRLTDKYLKTLTICVCLTALCFHFPISSLLLQAIARISFLCKTNLPFYDMRDQKD